MVIGWRSDNLRKFFRCWIIMSLAIVPREDHAMVIGLCKALDLHKKPIVYKIAQLSHLVSLFLIP